MAGFNFGIKINTATDAKGIKKAASATRDYSKGLQKLIKDMWRLTRVTNETRQRVNESTRAVDDFRNAMRTVVSGAAARQIYKVTNEFIALENILTAATDSSLKAGQEMDFLISEVTRLGTDLSTAGEGFARLQAAARGTALTTQDIREIFTATSEALLVMNADVLKIEGSFRALTQMISKGRVQSEELRGQLAEHIPGAFQIAARAMGVTQMELDKMITSGEVLAEDLLPKLARQLKVEFGAGVAGAMKSPRAEFNKLITEVKLFVNVLGQELAPIFSDVMNLFRTALEDLRMNVLPGVADAIKLVADNFYELLDTVTILATLFYGGKLLKGLSKFYKGIKAYSKDVKNAKGDTDLLDKAMESLKNTSGPGAVVIGILAAAAGLLSVKFLAVAGAVTAVTAGYVLWRKSSRDTENRLKEMQATSDSVVDSMVEAAEKFADAGDLQQQIRSRELFKNAELLLLQQIDDTTDAIERERQAIEATNWTKMGYDATNARKHLEELEAELERLREDLKLAQDQVSLTSDEVESLDRQLGNTIPTIESFGKAFTDLHNRTFPAIAAAKQFAEEQIAIQKAVDKGTYSQEAGDLALKESIETYLKASGIQTRYNELKKEEADNLKLVADANKQLNSSIKASAAAYTQQQQEISKAKLDAEREVEDYEIALEDEMNALKLSGKELVKYRVETERLTLALNQGRAAQDADLEGNYALAAALDEISTKTIQGISVLQDKAVEVYNTRQEMEKMTRVGNELGTAIGNAFGELAKGGTTAKDAIRNLLLAIQDLVVQLMIVEPIAKGISNAFSGGGGSGGGIVGSIVAGLFGGGSTSVNPGNFATNFGSYGGLFAKGGVGSTGLPHGVYSSPTAFPMKGSGMKAFASGTGIMGEAGPEAIMPLTRNNGRLGVEASGMAPVNITVNNLPGQDSEVSRDEDGGLQIDIIRSIISDDILRGGSKVSRSIEGAYPGIQRGNR